jgi:uncharacterized protein YbjT (DUF2867 family)
VRATALGEAGHAVRGTTRDRDALAAIEARGVEPALADPDRLATLLPHLSGVSVLVWLMGSASGEEERVDALHGSRLESIAGKLVDSGVRGLVYEAAGTVEDARLARGADAVRRVGAANRMPVEVVDEDPAEPQPWLRAMTAAVDRVLAA